MINPELLHEVAPYLGTLVNPYHHDKAYEWWIRSNVTDGCEAFRINGGPTTGNDCNKHEEDGFWRKPLCQLG